MQIAHELVQKHEGTRAISRLIREGEQGQYEFELVLTYFGPQESLIARMS
jgi:hypothetical protein